jgi:hypothetical protein
LLHRIKICCNANKFKPRSLARDFCPLYTAISEDQCFRRIPTTEIIIAGAARTPVGDFNGGLASVSASDLGKAAIE